MITQLLESCDKRYRESKCWICTYRKHCPHNCGNCLHYIHSPSVAPEPRKYDCGRMMDYYVCKYTNKYTSELYYAFSCLNALQDKKSLKVLSIGCGPCTDLLALDLLHENGIFSYNSLDYKGIDVDISIWRRILGNIRTLLPQSYNFNIIEADICKYIYIMIEDAWRPDLVVLQYVFSDMQKNCGISTIDCFLDALARYFELCDVNTYIVCNDINLSTRYNGGREYFDVLLSKINTSVDCRRCHFNNSNKPGHFHYGSEYRENRLVIAPPHYLDDYEPFMSCASAQMLIKKVN